MFKKSIMALALLTMTTFANASTFVIDQHNDFAPPSGGYTNLVSNWTQISINPVGQSFSPTATSLDHVELQLNAQYSTTAQVYVEILDSAGGTVLGTSNNTLSFTGATIELAHFEFSPIDISGYSSLFMNIVASSGSYGAFFAGGVGNNYAGGAAYFNGAFTTNDLWFRTGVSEVPVPAALFMFAPALLGFLGFRRKLRA